MSNPIFNSSNLLAWKEIDKDNWQGLATDIVKCFLETSTVQMEFLSKSWSNQELENVEKAAHALKSSCGIVGASEAFKLLDQIENASANNEVIEVGLLIHQFLPIFFESRKLVEEFIGNIQAA